MMSGGGEGGTDAMIKRRQDPSLRERIRQDMDDPNPEGWENQGHGSGGSDAYCPLRIYVSTGFTPAALTSTST